MRQFLLGVSPFAWARCGTLGNDRRRRKLEPRIEALESRQLLATGLTYEMLRPFVTDYFTQSSSPVTPGQVVDGKDGRLWFAGTFQAEPTSLGTLLGALGPDGQVSYMEQLDSALGISDLIVGPDGTVWFGERNTEPRIGRYVPQSNAGAARFTDFPIPELPMTVPVLKSLENLLVGPDGALWFSETGGLIVRTTAQGQSTLFPIPGPQSVVGGLALGPDGALWFTDPGDHSVGRITMSGDITDFPLPGSSSVPSGYSKLADAPPHTIVAGPDGALWLTDENNHSVDRVTTNGAVTAFPLPDPSGDPTRILVGPDKSLWFFDADPHHLAIGRVSTSGTVSEIPIPIDAGYLKNMTVGPDGAVWFAMQSFGAVPNQELVGRVTTDGTMTDLLFPGSNPGGITAGSDGDLWFSGGNPGTIVRIDPTMVLMAGGVTDSAAVGQQPVTITVANFTAPASDVQQNDITATIDWGGGTTSAGTITANPDGTYRVTGSHVFDQQGTDTITVSISDINPDSTAMSVTSTVQVTAPPLLPQPPTTVAMKDPAGGASAPTSKSGSPQDPPSVGPNGSPSNLGSILPTDLVEVANARLPFIQRVRAFFRWRRFELSRAPFRQHANHPQAHRPLRPLQPQLVNGHKTIAQMEHASRHHATLR